MFDQLTDASEYLAMLGTTLIDLDEDKEEVDDLAGNFALYASEVIDAVLSEEELPPLPELLAKGAQVKITGASRVIIILVRSTLSVARFKVKGSARKALNYVFQALGLLLQQQPIPAFEGSRDFKAPARSKPKS